MSVLVAPPPAVFHGVNSDIPSGAGHEHIAVGITVVGEGKPRPLPLAF
jgi:hypothetical protein